MITFTGTPVVKHASAAALAVLSLFCAALWAAEPDTSPRPIPLTRPEMKQYLEDMKGRTPRIPLPELTEADKEKLGERWNSYESRLRYHYLPSEGQSSGGRSAGGSSASGFGRYDDPDMTLDYTFKTQLFWIVSRTNNCQYCMGHQESKLLRAGMTEDEIAALDGDWLQHTPAQRAAYAFARKFTYQPHLLNDADIESLKKHYTEKQILEMVLSMAGNNSINRWKEGAGIPQNEGSGGFSFGPPRTNAAGAAAPEARTERTPDKPHSYLTPTSPEFQNAITRVAPVTVDPATGKPTRQAISIRPALEPRGEVEKLLAAARNRKPRLSLVDEARAKDALPEGVPAGPVPNWVRLLALFPNSAPGRVSSVIASEERGDLSPLLKAQMAWIIARQDRAWYATGVAMQKLQSLGWSEDRIYQLDGDWSGFTPRERSLFTLARKLGASPVVLTDADVAVAVKEAGPRDVVQAISYTTSRASFNRVTEAAGLPLDY